MDILEATALMLVVVALLAALDHFTNSHKDKSPEPSPDPKEEDQAATDTKQGKEQAQNPPPSAVQKEEGEFRVGDRVRLTYASMVSLAGKECTISAVIPYPDSTSPTGIKVRFDKPIKDVITWSTCVKHIELVERKLSCVERKLSCKVGDRVEIIKSSINHLVGEHATVTKTYESTVCLDLDDSTIEGTLDPGKWSCNHTRVKLLTEFKVGDRVEIIKSVLDNFIGEHATVTTVEGSTVDLDLDDSTISATGKWSCHVGLIKLLDTFAIGDYVRIVNASTSNFNGKCGKVVEVNVTPVSLIQPKRYESLSIELDGPADGIHQWTSRYTISSKKVERVLDRQIHIAPKPMVPESKNFGVGDRVIVSETSLRGRRATVIGVDGDEVHICPDKCSDGYTSWTLKSNQMTLLERSDENLFKTGDRVEIVKSISPDMVGEQGKITRIHGADTWLVIDNKNIKEYGTYHHWLKPLPAKPEDTKVIFKIDDRVEVINGACEGSYGRVIRPHGGSSLVELDKAVEGIASWSFANGDLKLLPLGDWSVNDEAIICNPLTAEHDQQIVKLHSTPDKNGFVTVGFEKPIGNQGSRMASYHIYRIRKLTEPELDLPVDKTHVGMWIEVKADAANAKWHRRKLQDIVDGTYYCQHIKLGSPSGWLHARLSHIQDAPRKCTSPECEGEHFHCFCGYRPASSEQYLATHKGASFQFSNDGETWHDRRCRHFDKSRIYCFYDETNANWKFARIAEPKQPEVAQKESPKKDKFSTKDIGNWVLVSDNGVTWHRRVLNNLPRSCHTIGSKELKIWAHAKLTDIQQPPEQCPSCQGRLRWDANCNYCHGGGYLAVTPVLFPVGSEVMIDRSCHAKLNGFRGKVTKREQNQKRQQRRIQIGNEEFWFFLHQLKPVTTKTSHSKGSEDGKEKVHVVHMKDDFSLLHNEEGPAVEWAVDSVGDIEKEWWLLGIRLIRNRHSYWVNQLQLYGKDWVKPKLQKEFASTDQRTPLSRIDEFDAARKANIASASTVAEPKIYVTRLCACQHEWTDIAVQSLGIDGAFNNWGKCPKCYGHVYPHTVSMRLDSHNGPLHCVHGPAKRFSTCNGNQYWLNGNQLNQTDWESETRLGRLEKKADELTTELATTQTEIKKLRSS